MGNNYSLKHVRDAVEELWPADSAENWDWVGLTVGQNSSPVKKVLFALDAVRATVDEAINLEADLLFTHHPLALRGIHSVAEDTYKGSLITDLIRNGCALLSAHTNADVPKGGVSDTIAAKLGLTDVEAIVEGGIREVGVGRVGYLKNPVTLEELANRLVAELPKTAVGARVAGDRQRKISRVALLGGSGDSLLAHPKVTVSDVYITSDLRHHPAQEALEQSLTGGGPALIDIPHWASESMWLQDAAKQFQQKLPQIEVVVSEINTDPWDFRVG